MATESPKKTSWTSCASTIPEAGGIPQIFGGKEGRRSSPNVWKLNPISGNFPPLSSLLKNSMPWTKNKKGFLRLPGDATKTVFWRESRKPSGSTTSEASTEIPGSVPKQQKMAARNQAIIKRKRGGRVLARRFQVFCDRKLP